MVLNNKTKNTKNGEPSNHDTPGLSSNERMQREWDARAEVDAKYFIKPKHNQTDNEFWKSGIIDCDDILGVNTSRYSQIIDNKNPKKMRVLEIGCGIGRILIPMSKIFGESIGVDVSKKIIEMGKKYIKDVPNCSILQTSGSDLTQFPDDHFDFCYSMIVFQHIPEKNIVKNYMREVSRVLKSGCLFRFQIFGDTDWKPEVTDTWNGVHFTSEEINQICNENRFEILEETGKNDQNYWLTFKSVK